MKINRKVLFIEAISIALFVAMPQPSLAQCKPTKKQRAVSAGILGAIGAVIGSAASYNRSRGALIGGGIGAALGVVAAKGQGCLRERRAEQARAGVPYNNQIAPANAPQPAAVNGPPVIIRNVNGADEGALEPILSQALARQGYSLVDRQSYDRNRIGTDYLLDITVRQVSGANGWGGSGFSRVSFSGYGNRAVGGGTYQVSVTMVNAKTGRLDPSRSATMDVQSVVYSSGNGYVTISSLSGYGGHSYYMNDPATGAAEEAINHFFGLTQ